MIANAISRQICCFSRPKKCQKVLQRKLIEIFYFLKVQFLPINFIPTFLFVYELKKEEKLSKKLQAEK
jgi:hypothetical protein